MTPWTEISSSQDHCLHEIAQKQKKYGHTSMLVVGFEPIIPVFERAKIVYALDHATTVIGTVGF
jgi:hypothetical protein